MNKLRFLACAVAAVSLFASCDRNEVVDDSAGTFEVNAGVQGGNTISVAIVPSNPDAAYMTGIIMEDDYLAMGQEGVASYIENLLAEGASPVAGNYNQSFTDLFWNTKYYLYAAYVSDGSVIGTPVVQEYYCYRAYVEFAPETTTIAPIAVSDNGLWVVGNYSAETNNSYIYDVRRDSLTVVPDVLFYDVTDDGVAYGRNASTPIIYRDGQVTTLTLEGNYQEAGFYGVSPDGSVAVGYMMDEAWNNQAIVYENGVFSTLTGTDLTDHEPAGIVAKGIGSNGNIVGYLVDFERYLEVGCEWTGTGHDFNLFPKDKMEWNDELLDGGGAYGKRYGGLEIFTSPNGRYYTSQYEYTESWDYMPRRVYVYDSEADEMYEITDAQYDDWRPCAVTSDGVAILADKSMGVSDYPYVYDIETGNVQLFADYAAATYNYAAPEGVEIQGSILMVDSSATVFVGNYTDSNAFYTTIYFMPR